MPTSVPTLRVALALAILLGTAPPALVSAQDAGADEARTLFNEGVALADRGDWGTAIERFERAIELHDAPTIRYNLAQTFLHLGRLTDAARQLDDLERGGAAPAALRTSAAALRAEIEPRIGRVTVRVHGPDAEACTVELGARALPAESLGQPLPADPGPARVRLFCGRTVVDEIDVSIPEGGSAHVVLAAIAAPERSDVLDDTAPVEAAPSRDLTSEPWFWVVLGVVVVGAAAGVTAGVLVATEPSPTQGNFGVPILEFGP